MSDLSLQLQQATSQLPVSSYFDEALFAREQELLFQRGPRYVGHTHAVPNVGDYFALPQEGEGRALVRTEQGVELVSNVCRHRQAVMLKGRGNLGQSRNGSAAGNIVCPLHRWTYSGGHGDSRLGELIGAPHFPNDPCLNLQRYPLREWNGLLFEDNGRDIAADLAGMGPRNALSFDGMVLDHVELHTCHYNWKTFIEVYLEDYHVGPFHPGLGQFVTICAGNSSPNTRCKPWACKTCKRAPAARCTSGGTSNSWRTAKAARPNKGPSGSLTTHTSWWSGTHTC